MSQYEMIVEEHYLLLYYHYLIAEEGFCYNANSAVWNTAGVNVSCEKCHCCDKDKSYDKFNDDLRKTIMQNAQEYIENASPEALTELYKLLMNQEVSNGS